MGRLLDGFAQTADMHRSYVLFTADHGESMMDHENWFSHGHQVYQELIRVPLMIRGSGIEPGMRRGPASSIDVAPTILGIAGVEIPADLQGLDLRHNGIIKPERVVFAEASWGSRHLRAAIGVDRKWIITLQGGQRTVLKTLHYDLNNAKEQALQFAHMGEYIEAS